MIICCICTGRHHSGDCKLADRFIEECRITISEAEPTPLAEVISLPLPKFEGDDRRAVRHWHHRHGINVARLG